MNGFVYGFVALMAILGSILVGNNLALFLKSKARLPYAFGFTAFIALLVVGALVAHQSGQLFDYGGKIALFGMCYSLITMGRLG